MLSFFTENDLISKHITGYKPGDFCYYLLHTIYTNHLIKFLMFVIVSSFTYLKHLIKYGTIALSSNYSKTAYFITFYQDLHCPPYVKPLSGLISIKATLFTTRLVKQIFIRKWN